MLLTAQSISKSFGPRQLFSGITLGLAEDDRVGLIGANGSGKSTMLRIFAGLEHTDTGEILTRRNLRVAYVAQEDTFPPGLTCLDVVAEVMDSHLDEHERHMAAQLLLDKASFPDSDLQASSLSGGWKKRLAIVRQLATSPELLLMDEPTNHLDIAGILWLEQLIRSAPFATLIVSHDRRFLESAANRTIELSSAYPDGYLSHKGTYSQFLEKREEFLEAQRGRQQSLASTVRREIEWLQRGAKARTTKAKGRIERAGDMIAELADLKTRNTKAGSAEVDFAASDRRTRKLVELKNVTKSLGGKTLFQNLSLVLSPGQKLGLLGPNGSGKSTLIRLITSQGTPDQLTPDSGTITRATDLRYVVFDQHRAQLDPDLTLRRALAPTGDTISFNGQSQHVVGWAKRFLFRTEQLDLPIASLSGGERARVLIARLMLVPADVLILDEPTNDLDIPTLDVLEESLQDFPGALVLVSHDRYMIERLATDILALDGAGHALPFADLTQWERHIVTSAAAASAAARAETKAKKHPAPTTPANTKTATTPTPAKKRLSWNDQRDLDNMESNIAKAEAEVATLQEQLADPATLADHTKTHDLCTRLDAAQAKVDALYARWTDLESRQ
jgi:ATP-binding cassette subfamily F protein uup